MSAYAAAPTQLYDVLPADTTRLIDRWEELGRPAIELAPGVIISNLHRWLYNNPLPSGVWLGRIREYLYIDTFGVGTYSIHSGAA